MSARDGLSVTRLHHKTENCREILQKNSTFLYGKLLPDGPVQSNEGNSRHVESPCCLSH